MQSQGSSKWKREPTSDCQSQREIERHSPASFEEQQKAPQAKECRSLWKLEKQETDSPLRPLEGTQPACQPPDFNPVRPTLDFWPPNNYKIITLCYFKPLNL